MIKHVRYKHWGYFRYVSVISFGYLKLTFDISMAFIRYDCRLLYDDTSQYLTKTVLYFSKRTVLKVQCYQNIYAEKHGRNLHVHIFIGDNHGEWRPY